MKDGNGSIFKAQNSIQTFNHHVAKDNETAEMGHHCRDLAIHAGGDFNNSA
ncbi:hypothetical protein NIES2104_45540 [Leptolyngbya sp. NIES-2104]|nr:hypothetical protein NIES2104_45540 [Leptolyngbya sp. NIES-2104]